MEHILKGIYLLEDSGNLLKVKTTNNIDDEIKNIFSDFYLHGDILKNYSLVDYNMDDDTQREFKVSVSNISLFGEIKTKIINHSDDIATINTTILNEIKDKIINSWVFHFLYMDDAGNNTDIILFQSFYKPNMYITPAKFADTIGLMFSGVGNSFVRKNYEDDLLNIKNNIDVIYLGGNEIYVLNRKKYINIFNHYEFVKNEAKEIFREKIITNDLFEIEDIEEFVAKIGNSYPIAKKIHTINNYGVLESLNLNSFETHVSNYNELTNIEVVNGKIKITTDNFKSILEILNQEFQECGLTGDKFKVNGKRRLG